MSFPSMVVESPFGALNVWATREGHMGFRTEGNLNVERKEGEAVKAIVVNGVSLSLRLDLTDSDSTEGGRWGVKEVAPGWFMSHNDLDIRRQDRWEPSSSAARAKVEKILIPWAIEFIGSEQGQALLAQAGGKRRQERIAALEATIVQAKADIEAAQKELVKLHLDEIQAVAS